MKNVARQAFALPLLFVAFFGAILWFSSASAKRDYREGQLAGLCADRAERRNELLGERPRGASVRSVAEVPAECFTLNKPRWRIGDSAKTLSYYSSTIDPEQKRLKALATIDK